MKSKGFEEKAILQVLNAMQSIIRKYTKPRYPQLKLEHFTYATELRIKYPELTFFDSLHASITLLNDLTYYDLDETIKSIVNKEA